MKTLLPPPPLALLPPPVHVVAARKQLKLFDLPIPPAPEIPEEVTEWFHTSQRPYHAGIYEVQQLFGEIHRLYYNPKKDRWHYVDSDNVSCGEMCCEGDSLHIIASGFRGLRNPAK